MVRKSLKVPASIQITDRKNRMIAAAVMLVVLLTSSFQMIMMGVLGEYLWRNLDETRKRPLYVIEKIVKKEEGKTVEVTDEDHA